MICHGLRKEETVDVSVTVLSSGTADSSTLVSTAARESVPCGLILGTPNGVDTTGKTVWYSDDITEAFYATYDFARSYDARMSAQH